MRVLVGYLPPRDASAPKFGRVKHIVAVIQSHDRGGVFVFGTQ